MKKKIYNKTCQMPSEMDGLKIGHRRSILCIRQSVTQLRLLLYFSDDIDVLVPYIVYPFIVILDDTYTHTHVKKLSLVFE